MRLSLSTNWCNRRIDDGREIAEKALELGFDELELGFHTTARQVAGFKAMLDKIPVGSVHAFCPVPLSAPQGYPELYQLATLDEEGRRMAVLQVTRNIDFAAEIGADTVVLHAGRVAFDRMFDRIDSGTLRGVLKANKADVGSAAYAKILSRAAKRRVKRGKKLLGVFLETLLDLVPRLVERGVTLALENLPYFEGFPAEWELPEIVAALKGAPVRGWFDTGHDRVREMHGWRFGTNIIDQAEYARTFFAGMHLNDVEDFNDDHFAPGDGKVDFAALGAFAANVRHVVFEPSQEVSEDSLRRSVSYVRALWSGQTGMDSTPFKHIAKH